MAFQAIKRIDAHWYIPEDQRDMNADGWDTPAEGEDSPTRFYCRALKNAEKSDVESQLGRDKGGTTNTFRDCFRMACTKIENVTNEKDRAVKFAQLFMQLTDEQAYAYMIEVGAHIFDISFDSDDEKKT